MRKINSAIIAIVMAAFTFISCDKETPVQENDLPDEIRTFVTTYFPANKIIQSVKDRDGLEVTYDLILDGNISLEFNGKKQITDIDGTTRLPDSVIPSKILNYVSANYPDNFIIGWELDDRNQQVKLDNRMELEFNIAGDFLRIDH
jgi:hypothetical protein